MKASRRTFLIAGIGAASSLALTRQALAAPEKVSESDPTAVALGYKHDAKLVDKAKQTKYVAGEHCGNCQLYQGKAGEEWGRSEERRVGKEGVSRCGSRWSPAP